MDGDGFLKITGRKKEMLITSTGKNITLTAIVTLDEEKTAEYAQQHEIPFNSFSELTRHPTIVKLIEKEIEVKNKELARIEQIKKFTILEDQFR